MFHSPLSSIAAAVLTAIAASAQVPFDFLVTAESNTAPDGFRVIDPINGVVTDIIEPDGNFLGSATTVAIDESATSAIVASAGGSFGGPPIWQIPLTANHYHFASLSGQGLSLFGSMGRMHATPNGILFTLSSVSDGLYTLSTIGGTPLLLSGLTKAMDIAVINGTAYVNSFVSGQPSTVIAVDLATQMVQTLGTNYPTIRSLGTIGGALIAGREDGIVDQIDVGTGVATPILATGLGSLIAIVEGSTPGNVFFATATNEVYSINDLTTPVYSSPHVLNDLDIGRVDQATQLLYGSPCSGSGSEPVAVPTAGPALGATYSMNIESAEAMASAAALIGLGRLDLDLGVIGFTGCSLLVDSFVTASTVVAANGDAGISFPVANNPALIGFQLDAQFFVLEAAATLAVSGGIEGHVR